MARQLKVFGCTLMIPIKQWVAANPSMQTHHAQGRCVVATTSRTAAEKLFGCGRNWVCETGNLQDIKAAMSKPGLIFWRPLDQRKDSIVWHELKPRGD